MNWYNHVLDHLDNKKTYSHKELMTEFRKHRPDLSDNSYHWAINGLVRDGTLTRQGYDVYAFSSDSSKVEYSPDYSETSRELAAQISDKYPHVQFTVFETVLMNEFLNHLVAQNTIFLQIEKKSSIYVFRFLQEHSNLRVIYKPGKKDFNLYWSKDIVVVTDMISEAPLKSDDPHSIMLEKMLVDISADKLIASTYSKAEFPDILVQAQRRYLLDKTRMMRYARRRNRYEELNQYFEGGIL